MRTVIFNQGFNRIESHNIIRLEHAKLNRLLDEERRVIESFASTVKRKIEAAPHRLFDVNMTWNQIQNHTFLQSLRKKINLLTDAYPQFSSQVAAVRARLQNRFFAIVNAARHQRSNFRLPQ